MFNTFGEAIDVYNRLDSDIRTIETKPHTNDLVYLAWLKDRQDEVARFIGIHVVIHHNVEMMDIKDIKVT